MTEELKSKVDVVITELEKDITYFNNLGFTNLTEKFKRDLDIIKSLVQEG